MKCWGQNNYGQVGDGTFDYNKLLPVDVTFPDNKYAIAMGHGTWFSCAVTNDNAVYCWGHNGSRVLGYTNVHVNQNAPLEVDMDAGGMGAISISAGESHACAVMTDGITVKCWGSGGDGGRGDLTWTRQQHIPQEVQYLGMGTETAATMIELGNNHGCVLYDEIDLWCWGQGGSGQLGIGNQSNMNHAVYVTKLRGMFQSMAS